MENPVLSQAHLATSSLLPRQAITSLPPYHAPQEGRQGQIRLDFNENTQGLPVSLDNTWTTYPEYQQLTQSLETMWGLMPGQVLLTNGSDEALFLVPFTFLSPCQATLISDPTFQMIPHYMQLCGAVIHRIPVLPKTLQLDLPAWEAALTTLKPRLVVLPSPDNPTGATVPLTTWEQWVANHPNTLFVLDQAYGEYEDAADAVLPLLAQYPNMLVTRTFSKAWGLAGLRLGVLLGQPQLIQWLAGVRSPFSVNQAAVQAVQALLPQAGAVTSAAKATVARKHWLMAKLADRGMAVHPAGGNFMLLNLGLDAALFCDWMAKHGILLRNRSSLLWGMVRLSVGSQAECDAFLTALDAYRQATVIMFDLDDTLVDTSQSFDTVVMDMVQQFSGQLLTRDALYALRAEGGFNDDWVATAELLKRRGIHTVSLDAIAQVGSQLYLERAAQTEHLMVSEASLRQLKRRFPKLAIATGRYRQEYAAVWQTRLDGLFNAVVCVNDAPDLLSKPHPSSLLAAMQHVGASQGVYIGNAVDDIKAAMAAELLPVGVVKTLTAKQLTDAGAQYVLSHIDQWPDMLPVA
jgi:histidinol-phosphate aminotransferase